MDTKAIINLLKFSIKLRDPVMTRMRAQTLMDNLAEETQDYMEDLSCKMGIEIT